uniref:SH3 domain binding protein 1 n=1 Tax=Leptobrachium leishanense TaxID=445787 RepID=A0A8C5QNS9_9ANUR
MIQRQLNRMRLLGNHGPGRSQDVTDMLTEDLLQADQQVEPVKKVAHLVGKRLANCMQGPIGSDMEKKLKKLALMSLSLAMADCIKELDLESSLRRTLEMGCYVENFLAQDLAEYEIAMEKDVLAPLYKLSEEELPGILKHRKQLQKLITDWNSAKSRLAQMQKNVSGGTGGGSTTTPAKLESLKEEEEELRRKLEQSKDDYLSDLYQFTTKEEEYENYFIRLLELQAEYHRKSLSHLTDTLKELRDTLKETVRSPVERTPAEVYGVPLETHLSRFGCTIAVPISACVKMLLTEGIHEEGLFRLAAGASMLKKIKACLGAGTSDLAEFTSEPHAVAGALKSYLRELPEPLMTSERFDDWMKAASTKDPEKRVESYKEVCKQLPAENYNNLRYLIMFLSKLSEHQEVNKMTPSNIAIVLGPNLLWAKCDGEPSMLSMASASPILVVSVVEGLINCAGDVFPEDIDFGVPETASPVSTVQSTPMVEESAQGQIVQNADETPPPAPPLLASADRESEIASTEAMPIKQTPLKPLVSIEEGSPTTPEAEASPNTARKVKRPAPQRPSMPPPIQPRSSSTENLEDNFSPKPIPRRIIGGSLRVPNIPPPHPPPPTKVSNTKSESITADSSGKAPPPTPMPRNRIQSVDN